MEGDITFAEFKAWMNGMIYGRGNNLPDAGDWKLIKQMMERVVPDKVEIQNPITPWTPITAPVVPYTDPYTPPPIDKWVITCSNDSISLTDRPAVGSMHGGGDYGCTNQSTTGLPLDFGITNGPLLPQGSLMPCPVVAVGNTEDSDTPALDKARVMLKRFKGDE